MKTVDRSLMLTAKDVVKQYKGRLLLTKALKIEFEPNISPDLGCLLIEDSKLFREVLALTGYGESFKNC